MAAIRMLVITLALVGTWQLGGAGMIKAKALLAPVLIERAWQRTLEEGGGAQRPWPWADTWPVAWLRLGSMDLPVLHGDSGNALAFAPGRALASAPFGSGGTTVIGGHRDTHFAFLRDIRTGQVLQLQLADGAWRDYAVTGARIVDARLESMPRPDGPDRVLLVTCYPIDALRAGGPLRYVVTAQRLPRPGEALASSLRDGSVTLPGAYSM